MKIEFESIDAPVGFTMREVLTEMLTKEHGTRSAVRAYKPGQEMTVYFSISMVIKDNTEALEILDEIEDREYQARRARKDTP